MIVIIVDIPIVRVSVQHLENCATDVVRKITLRKNADPVIVDLSLSQDMTQEGQIGPKEIEVIHTGAVYMEYALKKVVMTTQ